ncbi:MAG: HAMP domain-containing histidine kinase [Candidatus Hydrogenedentes bacterium]|nr:HAMP domain-containing histidine kinase [Candidatus Hydrogenedentota bacterium]
MRYTLSGASLVPMGDALLSGKYDAGSSGARVEEFRYQELVFIGLNVCALGFIALIHLAFAHWVSATRSVLVYVLLLSRMSEQGIEAYLLWRRVFALTKRGAATYSFVSLCANTAFAFTVSILSETDEAHFIALLMVPLIQACFRYRLRTVIAVALMAMVLNFLELWTFYYLHPKAFPTHKPLEHQFELATMALIYPFVGILVHILVQRTVKYADDSRRMLDDLRATQRHLLEKEKLAAVGQLVNVISHELRHPVAVVTNALDAALRKGDASDPERQFIGLAAVESKRLDKLTKDLLTFAQPKEPQKKPTSARLTLTYVRDLLAAQLPAEGPRIDVACDEDFDIEIDPFQMHQALLNLGINAINYTEPGGRVLLGADRAADCANLFVENSGSPIPDEIAERIFEPFYTTRQEGSGLGLAISRKIAESHGGGITLAANKPGQVRFVVSVPL